MVEYGHDYIRVFDDRTFPVWSPEHPRIPGVVYVDKHQQPSHDPCLASALQQAYGQLDVPHLINVTSALATGNTHTAIYDFARSEMYVASASSARHPPVVLASFRSFTKFDLKALWTEPHP